MSVSIKTTCRAEATDSGTDGQLHQKPFRSSISTKYHQQIYDTNAKLSYPLNKAATLSNQKKLIFFSIVSLKYLFKDSFHIRNL